ncbi:type IV secretory system conjugative DNA transfer family protein [Paracoccaceae bacterium GXU_MW_L88]
MGKSTLLKQDILEDITDGHGVLYIDPHGHDTDELLQYIPRKRRNDVILFDPTQYSIPFNPLAIGGETPFIASAFTDSIKDAWGYRDIATPRIDSLLYNSVHTLIDNEQSLLGLYFLITSQPYREKCAPNITDPMVQRYWQWYADLNEKDRFNISESTLNKVQILLSDKRIRHSIGHKKTQLNLSDVFKGKIVFVRIPQGALGLSKTSLIGSLVLSNFHLTALSQAPTTTRVYVDEAHLFSPSVLNEMLSGIRKFGVRLKLSHQYMHQLDMKLRHSVLANCASFVFRCSFEDMQYFPSYEYRTSPYELFELPPYNAVVFGDGRPYAISTTAFYAEPFPKSEAHIRTRMVNQLIRSPKTVDSLFSQF